MALMTVLDLRSSCSLGVATIARRDEVFEPVVMTIMVQMINYQRKRASRITLSPRHLFLTPMARLNILRNGIVKHHSVDENAAIRKGKRMIRSFYCPVSTLINNTYRIVSSTMHAHPPRMQTAEPILRVWSIAAIYGAILAVPVMGDITMMLQPPPMHLAHARARFLFATSIYGAKMFSWKVRGRVTIFPPSSFVFCTKTMSVMFFVTALNGTQLHALSISNRVSRSPSFYSGTMCVHCGKHFPVGADGEFVWEDGTRVGT